ncbi:hypothetical protein GF343_00350 [Candidatus Woesearchaeota archaeon]|nr:hypothetical protein [Candidatus Woesearchaeota archaeon]
MKKKKKWITPVVIIVILLLAVTGYYGYYFYALSQLQVTDVHLNELTEFSMQGFAFDGSIELYNPCLIDVTVEKIDYRIIFEPTQQVLSVGSIPENVVPAGNYTIIPFSKSIRWAPALSLVLGLATSDQPVNIAVIGDVAVTESIHLPFVYKMDVREYLKDYANKYYESQKQAVVEKVEEKYGRTAGAIAEHVAGYLPGLI